MAIADYDEVNKLLKDFEPRLRSVVDRAWAEWMETPNKGRFLFKRTRSNIVFDTIARIAIEEFSSDKDIHIIVKSQTMKFLFKDQVLVRFKKGNIRGIGSNIETQAALDFIDPQITVPGFLPTVHRVEVCYKLDDLATTLKEVAVVARDRTKRIWHYLIEATASGAEIITLVPAAGVTLSDPIVTPRNATNINQSNTSENKSD